MVTRSIDNYQKYKEEVFEKIKGIYGEKSATTFINWLSERYDKFNRSFIDYNIALQILDDYLEVKDKNGIITYAVVGIGGSGKTTIAKNIGYLLDPTINPDRIKEDVIEMVEVMDLLPENGALKVIILDEPDSDIQPTSLIGKKFRSILGKLRQQQLFPFYCATDLNDLPSYIYKKVNRLIFCPYKGKAIYFKDDPENEVYTIQFLKNQYRYIGFKAFLNNKHLGLQFDCSKETPLKEEEEKLYLENKKKNYKQEISELLALSKEKDPSLKKQKQDRFKLLIEKLKEEGYSDEKIGNMIGLDRTTVNKYRKTGEFELSVG